MEKADTIAHGTLAQAAESPFDGRVEVSPTSQSDTVYMSNLFNPDNTTLDVFFNYLFMAAIAAGAALAVLRLGYAGIMYMMTDLISSKQNARQMISEVVLGLLLLLAVWIILNQINPDLLNLNVLRSGGGATQ
jgi:hypothetical protein